MATSSSTMLTVVVTVLSCLSPAVNGQLLDFLGFIAEAPVAALLDANSPIPLRTTGFETLVPERSIRIHCAKPSSSFFEEILPNETEFTRKINFSKPLAVVTHGWTESSNTTLFQNLTSRYRRFVDTNVCTVDWAPYAEFNYQTAARRSVPLVAQRLSNFLQAISVLYYDLSRVSLVGFSMGGQISGLTGKNFPGRIGAIYALDPAGPLFTLPFDVGTSRRLTGSDAQYVQQIATSRYAIGMGQLVGVENFLPNRGYHPQTPCSSLVTGSTAIQAIICSHRYAVVLFTAALDPANVVLGQRCSTLFGIPICLPGLNPTDRLGIYANRLSGNFYL
ncbi:phospholipase A1 member A-like [Anopheles albimanus]|uniref:Uncharacterized protein n=1 Tax=Anopheles albimanus TaxID=7167 RepID=A0A182F6X0_ANOAL|nr:phospholipase A1 member A-like [Anopheles albimanus]